MATTYDQFNEDLGTGDQQLLEARRNPSDQDAEVSPRSPMNPAFFREMQERAKLHQPKTVMAEVWQHNNQRSIPPLGSAMYDQMVADWRASK